MQFIHARIHCPVQYSLMRHEMRLEKDAPCPFLQYLKLTEEDWRLYCSEAQLEIHTGDKIPNKCIEILPEDIIEDIHYEESDKPFSHDQYVAYLEQEIYPVSILSSFDIYAFIHKYKIW